MSTDSLRTAAFAFRANAFAPYIENATCGSTVCAERVAIFKAVSEGARKFVRVAVDTDNLALTPRLLA